MPALDALGLSALIGLGIGLASGLLGIGGGAFFVPVFRLVFGMSPVASVATSLLAVVPTSLSGMVAHLRGGTCVLGVGLALGAGGALASPLGARLAASSPGWAVMLAASLVVGSSAVATLRKARALRSNASVARSEAAGVRTGREGADAGVGAGANADASAGANAAPAGAVEGSASAGPVAAVGRVSQGPARIACAMGIGALAGLASGYVGVGGGFVMVPLMVWLLGVPVGLAPGTSLVAVVILAVPGVAQHALAGNVDFVAGAAMVVGTIPGAQLGARLSWRMPAHALALAFGCVMLAVSAMLALNEFMA
ncbi:sulfite exporter TauE/SafE family protein [Berryella wangjianweii]|uniref:Probable membrane transporter protein n=1 Tax=Berryella wangjianweii TaxID=2734634 RepID=A0A6M8J2Y6_9ACTN|nr:sulfite exporter TauE/SafE family protein [Berryella wangjianweii]QKF07481.1 sulfite exporter TauE/SafE family protein [Berryella wangjianweii]